MTLKIKRFARWIGSAVLAMFLVLIACWNLLPDEPLNPDIEKLLSTAPPPPSEDNAFFMMFGLAASPDLDAHTVGRQIIIAHDRLLSSEKGLRGFDYRSFMGANVLAAPQQGTLRLCDVQKENCVRVYQSKQAQIAEEISAKKVYVDRYQELRSYKEYSFAFSSISSESPAPAWAVILRVSDLVDANIATRMASPDARRAALEELAADIASWKRCLSSNDWLLTQQLSMFILLRKYKLMSDIMNIYPEVATTHADLVKQITTPLDHREVNAVAGILAETRTGVTTILDAKKQLYPDMEDSLKKNLLTLAWGAVDTLGGFRTNATANRFYARMALTADHLSRNPREILQQQGMYNAQLSRLTSFELGNLFYNPVGTKFTRYSFPDWVIYGIRINDLIGLTRLLELQRQIALNSVLSKDVDRFLAKADVGLRDPHSEQPMRWDPDKKQVSFPLRGDTLKKFPAFGYVSLDHVE